MRAIKTSPTGLFGSIDELREIGFADDPDGQIGRGSLALIRGWVLTQHDTPVSELSVAIGNGDAVAAITGLARPDVGRQFGTHALSSGFVVSIPIDAPYGHYAVTVTGCIGDQRSSVAMERRLEITPARTPFEALVRDDAAWTATFETRELAGGAWEPFAPSTSPIVGARLVRIWATDARSGEPANAVAAREGGLFFDVAPEGVGRVVAIVPPAIGTSLVRIFAIGFEDYGLLAEIALRSEADGADVRPYDATVLGAIESVAIAGVEVRLPAQVRARRGAVLEVRGWAIDAQGPRLASGVELLVDGALHAHAVTGLPRGDVADRIGEQALVDCGFSCTLSTADLALGAHVVTARVGSARNDAFGTLPALSFILEVTPQHSELDA